MEATKSRRRRARQRERQHHVSEHPPSPSPSPSPAPSPSPSSLPQLLHSSLSPSPSSGHPRPRAPASVSSHTTASVETQKENGSARGDAGPDTRDAPQTLIQPLPRHRRRGRRKLRGPVNTESSTTNPRTPKSRRRRRKQKAKLSAVDGEAEGNSSAQPDTALGVGNAVAQGPEGKLCLLSS